MKHIIDTYLKKLVDTGLNSLPVDIEPEMADPDQDENDEWHSWLPVDSKVSNAEIEEIEGRIGHKFPDD